jgi:hypothetical protein
MHVTQAPGGKTPAVRLVRTQCICDGEAAAARSGLANFARYGVACDSYTAGTEAVRGMRRGRELLHELRSDSVLAFGDMFLGYHVLSVLTLAPLRAGNMFGIGLTHAPLVTYRPGVPETMEAMRASMHEPSSFADPFGGSHVPSTFAMINWGEGFELIGAGRFDGGAVVSVSQIREIYGYKPSAAGGRTGGIPTAASTAIQLAVMRAAGEVFVKRSPEGPCEREDCLLQKVDSPQEFVGRIVQPGLIFCSECAELILARVNELTKPADA